ncbi:hypothetical protein VYU27_003893 [Nannochloropsis oceanica]
MPLPRRRLLQGPPRTAILPTLLFAGYAFVLLLQAVSAFVLPNSRHHHHHRQHYYHVQPTSTRLALSQAFSLGLSADQVEEKLEELWMTDVPSSLDSIIDEAQASLGVALAAGEKRLRVDVRTPGMDEQFEQTAIREKALLLGVIEAFFPLFAAQPTKILFDSEGDAALASKAYSRGFDIPATCSFAGLSPQSIAPTDEIIFLIEPTNRPGSPVISAIQSLLDTNPDKTFILFNPNLEPSGAGLGIRERDRRQQFLDSFKSAYIYLCLASLSRPALIPRELGTFHYQFEQNNYRLLRCLLTEDGPGSLNRFLKRPIYPSSSLTPTATNPPKFYLVKEWAGVRPAQEELSRAMQGAEAVLEGLIRGLSEGEGGKEGAARSVMKIETVDEAKRVLVEASQTRKVAPELVGAAISFLEKSARKGKKSPEDGEKEAEELLRKITGRWRLIFTTGTKGTQNTIGKINYFPVKAVQSFGVPFSSSLPPSSPSEYANVIYLGPWPVVQVLGSFNCPKFQKLEFKVDSIKLGPVGFGSKGDGFFTFFYVDEAVAVARGQGGGLALWYKQ